MTTVRVCIAAAALAAVVGCGGPSTASVTGTVTYEGQPVGEGFITFFPKDGKGKDAGAPIANGQYTVKDMPPGPKVVKVIGLRKVNFAASTAELEAKANEARKKGNFSGLVEPADTIADDAEGNNATVDVVAGNQTRDFNLKKSAKTGR